ncbi:hypothetical protein [Patulibacter minatonensis]|uniref:hypothetical protein n=1 Tax=Patulibacter minatonensis TaxID=298163 RepID=UPI00047DF73B|nr:hypothetical protein [Patulibacter minatonensis]
MRTVSQPDRRPEHRPDEWPDRSVVAVGRLVDVLRRRDPVDRLRAAHLLEVVSRRRPDLLGTHVPTLLAVAVEDPDLVLPILQVLPRLEIRPVDRDAVESGVRRWHDHEDAAVRVCVDVVLIAMGRTDDPGAGS